MKIKILHHLPKEINNLIPFFSNEDYLNSISNEYGWLTDDLENIYLPFYIKQKLIFKYAIITDGVFCFTKITDSQLKLFLNNSINYLRTNMNIDYIPPTSNHCPFKIIPDNVIYARFGTYKINISDSIENIAHRFHIKHNNAIKKAIRDDIYISFDRNNFNIFYDIYLQTMSRSKIPIIAKDILFKIFENNSNKSLCGVAFLNNVPQAACLIFYDKLSAYYTYGATISKPSQGSSNLLQYELIKELKNLKCEEYNLVGARINPAPNSKYYTIQQYKQRFGANLHEGLLWKAYLSKKSILIKFLKLFNIIKSDIIDQEK